MSAHQNDIVSLKIELKSDQTIVWKVEAVVSFKLLSKHFFDKTWEVINMAAIWHF
jgi:hypothetical protein